MRRDCKEMRTPARQGTRSDGSGAADTDVRETSGGGGDTIAAATAAAAGSAAALAAEAAAVAGDYR